MRYQRVAGCNGIRIMVSLSFELDVVSLFVLWASTLDLFRNSPGKLFCILVSSQLIGELKGRGRGKLE